MGRFLRKFSLLFALTFAVNTTFSQEKKLKKAKELYDRYEYIGAQKTYLKIVGKGHKSADIYKNLANSYYFNSQFSEAMEWYEKFITSYPEEVEPEYYFRYAQTLKSTKRYEEADGFMQKFTEIKAEDQRAILYQKESNYLERIDFQSGRYEIENVDINSWSLDFGTAFYGNSIVFSSSRDTIVVQRSVHQWNEKSFLDLYVSKLDSANGKLSGFKKLDSKINSKFHESTPVFTKDGNTVYFTRNNFDIKRKYQKDKEGTNKLKIYRAYKNAKGKWKTPRSLPFNSNEYSVAHPALSSDEKTLYFSSDMPGSGGLSDLYKISINEDGSFGEPENLGNQINTPGKETFPFISKNNDLYFASDGHIGLGGLDVFVTRLNPQNNEEATVVNIGKPINGPQDDFAFIVDDESKIGFFSSNRSGGKGYDDIYMFRQQEELKSFCEITIAGVVRDKDSNELLPGTKVSIYDGDNKLVQTYEVGDTADFTQKLDCESKYLIKAEKDEYITVEKPIETSSETQLMDTPLILEKEAKIADVGEDLAKVLSLNPIYFDFDQSYVRDDASIEITKVIEAMIQYPKMKVDVRSHTDSHGDDAYNLELSNRRAQATIEYMIKKGIAADRLTGKGFGETQPVNDCGNESNCPKSAYELNRRSEFIIVK